jgi:hypothetical protein
MFFYQLVQTLAFAAQNDYGGPRIIDFAVQIFGALVQTVNPESFFFQRFQSLGHVADADHRQMFQCSGRGFRHGFSESGGAAIWNQNRRCSGGMRGADDGAQVVRIFDAVQ